MTRSPDWYRRGYLENHPLPKQIICDSCGRPFESVINSVKTCTQCLIRPPRSIDQIKKLEEKTMLSKDAVRAEKLCEVCKKPYIPTGNCQVRCPECRNIKPFAMTTPGPGTAPAANQVAAPAAKKPPAPVKWETPEPTQQRSQIGMVRAVAILRENAELALSMMNDARALSVTVKNLKITIERV